MTVIQTTVGDSAPAETITVKRKDGSTVNLTGATVNFHIQDPINGTVTNSSTSLCAITNASGGVVVYTWHSTDLPDVGIYNAYLVVTYSDGTKETYTFLIEAAPTA